MAEFWGSLQSTTEKCTKEEILSFPKEIFPKNIQDLIEDAEKTVGYNSDFLSAGIVSTSATAIGNKVKLENGSYESRPILWTAIVGRSGVGKTHALKFAKKPLENIDRKKHVNYLSQMQTYESKKENGGEKPKNSNFILKDFTPKKLNESLQYNKKGVLIFKDELIGWIKSFNRYRKGADQQMYLELFNGDSLNIDRVSKNPIRIENPNVNIIGGIQPVGLQEMASNNRNEDGFLARFLFVLPSDLVPFKFSGKKIDSSLEDKYEEMIKTLCDTKPKTLKATESQIEIYKTWQHKKAEECFNDEVEALIQSKLETYVWRLALIIEMMKQASEKIFSDDLTDESMRNAIKLIEYFRTNALKVYDRISSTNPLDSLPSNKIELFNELDQDFKRGNVGDIFIKHNVKGGAIARFLNNRELFIRVDSKGNYKKRFE